MQAGCGLGGQKRLPTQLLQAGQAGEDKSLAGLGEGWEEETLPWTAPPPIQVLMSSSPGAGREEGGGEEAGRRWVGPPGAQGPATSPPRYPEQGGMVLHPPEVGPKVPQGSLSINQSSWSHFVGAAV